MPRVECACAISMLQGQMGLITVAILTLVLDHGGKLSQGVSLYATLKGQARQLPAIVLKLEHVKHSLCSSRLGGHMKGVCRHVRRSPKRACSPSK